MTKDEKDTARGAAETATDHARTKKADEHQGRLDADPKANHPIGKTRRAHAVTRPRKKNPMAGTIDDYRAFDLLRLAQRKAKDLMAHPPGYVCDICDSGFIVSTLDTVAKKGGLWARWIAIRLLYSLANGGDGSDVKIRKEA